MTYSNIERHWTYKKKGLVTCRSSTKSRIYNGGHILNSKEEANSEESFRRNDNDKQTFFFYYNMPNGKCKETHNPLKTKKPGPGSSPTTSLPFYPPQFQIFLFRPHLPWPCFPPFLLLELKNAGFGSCQSIGGKPKAPKSKRQKTCPGSSPQTFQFYPLQFQILLFSPQFSLHFCSYKVGSDPVHNAFRFDFDLIHFNAYPF